MDISDNIVESKKDADSIAKAISEQLESSFFSKGQTNFIPVCPLQWLGMQRCGMPSSKKSMKPYAEMLSGYGP